MIAKACGNPGVKHNPAQHPAPDQAMKQFQYDNTCKNLSNVKKIKGWKLLFKLKVIQI